MVGWLGGEEAFGEKIRSHVRSKYPVRRQGASNPRSLCSVLGAVEAVAVKRARSKHFDLSVTAWRAGMAEDCGLGLGACWRSKLTCACNAMTMVLGMERKIRGSGRTRRPSRRRMIERQSWVATLPVQTREGLITYWCQVEVDAE